MVSICLWFRYYPHYFSYFPVFMTVFEKIFFSWFCCNYTKNVLFLSENSQILQPINYFILEQTHETRNLLQNSFSNILYSPSYLTLLDNIKNVFQGRFLLYLKNKGTFIFMHWVKLYESKKYS